MVFMAIIFYFSKTCTKKIKLKNFNTFHSLAKQTFNQPLLIYNISCVLRSLIKLMPFI